MYNACNVLNVLLAIGCDSTYVHLYPEYYFLVLERRVIYMAYIYKKKMGNNWVKHVRYVVMPSTQRMISHSWHALEHPKMAP